MGEIIYQIHKGFVGNKLVYTCKVLKTLHHRARTPEMFEPVASGLGIYVKIIVKQWKNVYIQDLLMEIMFMVRES